MANMARPSITVAAGWENDATYVCAGSQISRYFCNKTSKMLGIRVIIVPLLGAITIYRDVPVR
jgi:hypothetical protein